MGQLRALVENPAPLQGGLQTSITPPLGDPVSPALSRHPHSASPTPTDTDTHTTHTLTHTAYLLRPGLGYGKQNASHSGTAEDGGEAHTGLHSGALGTHHSR